MPAKRAFQRHSRCVAIRAHKMNVKASKTKLAQPEVGHKQGCRNSIGGAEFSRLERPEIVVLQANIYYTTTTIRKIFFFVISHLSPYCLLLVVRGGGCDAP